MANVQAAIATVFMPLCNDCFDLSDAFHVSEVLNR